MEPEKCTRIGTALMAPLRLVVQNLSVTLAISSVWFSSGTFCSAEAGASTRWTKLDLTGLKLIFGKQSPICQSSKKNLKKCYNFPIGNVTFSLPDLGFMRMWVGVGV